MIGTMKMIIDSLEEVFSFDFKLCFGMVRSCMSLLNHSVNMSYIVFIVTSCSDALALMLQTRLSHRMNCSNASRVQLHLKFLKKYTILDIFELLNLRT
jgi:hypothetical protein